MNETKINGETLDIADENIANLRQLFPEVFIDGKIDFSMLKQSLGEYVDDESEKYKFTWNCKGKAINLAQTPSTGTLRPCPGESKNFDETENLYIEGDNLEVLKLLQKSYYNKVKMIYIDPPYNTGKDFVYKDNFKDNIANYLEITGQTDENGKKTSPNTETSGRYHTDWLNMMYPRLRLARNLLRDDGVIFISIDDNEVHNLRKICDEVFGERNFVSQFVWNSSTGGGIRSKLVNKNHEYALLYAKNKEILPMFFAPLSLEAIKEYNKKDAKGTYREKDFAWTNQSNNENQQYLIKCPDGSYIKPKSGYIFRFVEETFLEYLKKGYVVFKETASGPMIDPDGNQAKWNIYIKKYLENGMGAPTSLIPKSIVGLSNLGTDTIQDLFGESLFSNSKSINYLEYLINIGLSNGDIILDFFSGSATTAHAVMHLNAEDGGNRKFIMVQLPELTLKYVKEKYEDENGDKQTREVKRGTAYKAGYKNICEIGKERIRRAGEKIKTETLEFNKKIKDKTTPRKVPDIGFKVLKLARSNFKKWQLDPENIEASLQENLDNHIDNRTDMDFIYEIMIKYGISLTSNVETLSFKQTKLYYINCQESSDCNIIICLDDNIKIDTANFIVKHKTDKNIDNLRVVFKDSGFNSDEDKINTREILKCGEIQEFITI